MAGKKITARYYFDSESQSLQLRSPGSEVNYDSLPQFLQVAILLNFDWDNSFPPILRKARFTNHMIALLKDDITDWLKKRPEGTHASLVRRVMVLVNKEHERVLNAALRDMFAGAF